jgi:type I restriction enzyme S subunit
MNENNSISNKEALKDKIHEIHNYIRNNGIGYGMNALKVFNVLYGLKKIEEKNLLEKIDLSSECKFSYLLKLANENKDEKLVCTILGNVLDSLSKSKIRELSFYEIPCGIKGCIFSHLVKEIDKITIIEKTCNVLLSGKIYEYFIGRDETAISELGAYFTDRHIVNYIYDKLNLEINEDKSIDTMIDMFGGSGGFTTGYVNFLNKKYPNIINWETEINKIYHYDMNTDVVKSAGLELFCLSGVIPDMINNVCYKNSFTYDFDNKKFKRIITNPPYGGDKNKKNDIIIKREKIKKYIKNELLTLTDEKIIQIRNRQLKNIENDEKIYKKETYNTKVSIMTSSQRIIKYAKKYNLSGNDKESVSLIMMMNLLDENGIAVGVLKEGIFFNKAYKNLRKCLLNNFNITDIISIPSDQFENTSTKTTIIIFNNFESKTSKINFYDLKIDRFEEDKFCEINDKIMILENKGDIKNVSDNLISIISYDEINNHFNCSLNAKDYSKKEFIATENYKMVKLKNICEFLPKSKHSASDGKEEGLYNFYPSSQNKILKCDKYDYEDECIIIGTGGSANIKFDSKFSCTSHNTIIKSKNKNISTKYIYYYLINNIDIMQYGFNGSCLQNLSIDYIKNIEIPIPKLIKKINSWTNKISEVYDKKNQKQLKINELENQIYDKIKNMSIAKKYKLNDICDFNYENIKKNYTGEINYIDISSIKNGQLLELKNYKNIKDAPESAKRIIHKNDILISSVRINLPNYYFMNDEIKNGICSNAIIVIRSNNKNISSKYIYYYIIQQYIRDDLLKKSSGSLYPHCNIEHIKNIEIPIPDSNILSELELIFNEIYNLKIEFKETSILYKNYLDELTKEAISK